MSTDEIHLDEQTLARAKRLAQERNVSVAAIVSEAIERFSIAPSEPSNGKDIIGAFSDCAELLDKIVEEAYQARERYPLRQKSE